MAGQALCYNLLKNRKNGFLKRIFTAILNAKYEEKKN
jgi:hypothetical protein